MDASSSAVSESSALTTECSRCIADDADVGLKYYGARYSAKKRAGAPAGGSRGSRGTTPASHRNDSIGYSITESPDETGWRDVVESVRNSWSDAKGSLFSSQTQSTTDPLRSEGTSLQGPPPSHRPAPKSDRTPPAPPSRQTQQQQQQQLQQELLQRQLRQQHDSLEHHLRRLHAPQDGAEGDESGATRHPPSGSKPRRDARRASFQDALPHTPYHTHDASLNLAPEHLEAGQQSNQRSDPNPPDARYHQPYDEAFQRQQQQQPSGRDAYEDLLAAGNGAATPHRGDDDSFSRWEQTPAAKPGAQKPTGKPRPTRTQSSTHARQAGTCLSKPAASAVRPPSARAQHLAHPPAQMKHGHRSASQPPVVDSSALQRRVLALQKTIASLELDNARLEEAKEGLAAENDRYRHAIVQKDARLTKLRGVKAQVALLANLNKRGFDIQLKRQQTVATLESDIQVLFSDWQETRIHPRNKSTLARYRKPRTAWVG
ncbi:hypothetical protein DIPPA_01859 [Diplonema papillatum]|nr:hypothetical protein DIPPA_01859 [Diplonema papillatum]